MGVTGLWKLIESSGKPVPLETLENKVLAIDISIWLHQVTKGFQDAKGSTLPNAHLLGLFHRLCKLLFYRIKPIFVFDGSVPALKRQTIAKRAQSKNKLLNEAERLQNLLLATLAKEKVVQQALGSTAVDILAKSPVKPPVVSKSRPDIDEMFILPPLVEEEDPTPGRGALSPAKLNLHSIDVDSSNFKTLPADVRHEILTDIKETRKQSSWGRLHELPAHSDSFSSFQMQRLLKRRKVQVCLESAEKEMGGQSLSVQDLERMLTEEGIVKAEASAKRIHSDDSTRFLMVSSIKQAMEKALQSEQAKDERRSSGNDLGPEFNEDLKRAVQMSLNTEVDENEDQEIFLSAKQKSNLTETAKEMARAYMMEHAGMSKEDVDAILGEVGEDGDAEMSLSLDESWLALIEKNEMKEAIKESLKEENNKSESAVTAIESDLINKSNVNSEKGKADSIADEKKSLEIVIDPNAKITEEEDLFADVFQSVGVMEDTVTVVEDIEDSSEEEEEGEKEVSTNANCDDFRETKSTPEMNVQESVIDLDEDDSEEGKVSRNVSPTNESCSSSEAEIIAELNDSSLSSHKVTAIDLINVIESKAHVDPKTILESLERQKAEIVNLTLDDVEIKGDLNVNSIIEIPSSPEGDNEELKGMITPSKKRKMLTDYFETSPRKTPKKVTPGKEEVETVPYVKSPFYVKRTPRKGGRSSEKKVVEFPVQVPGSSKAAKSLFGKVEDGEQEPQHLKTNEELIKEASDLLRSQKSAVELEGMAEDLKRQERDLEQERNKQSRKGVTVTERMSLECQDMLRLFGIPFIVAPMEAEAQCAFLNSAEITHGTITDDSDVWLFGGATVYKNFFDNKKHVMEFRMATIEQLYHVDRKKLIQLALLVGSDYTTGITGIGAVTGMEILAQFPTTPASSEEGVSEYQAMVSGLRRFKEWWAVSHQGGKSSGQAKGVLRNKLKNISIGESFPSQAVVEAYLYPRVDENRAEFSWGTLDVETIREFARKNFGWTRTRTDELLLPVVKKWEEKRVQKSIRNYFNADGMSPGKGRVAQMSKRMKKAVEKMDPNKKDGDEDGVPKAKKPRKKRVGKVKTEEDVKGDSDCQVVEEKTENKGKVAQIKKQAMEVLDINKPSMSKRSTRAVRIPDADQVIPQRDRTKQLEEEKKRKAAEIFQKNKEGKKMKD